MIKIYLLIGGMVFAFGSGYFTSNQFHKAADYKAAEKALVAFTESAQDGIDTLQSDWESKHKENIQLILAADVQRKKDAENEAKILKSLGVTQAAIDGIRGQISNLENVGACKLGPDFLRLWNAAIEAANTQSPEG